MKQATLEALLGRPLTTIEAANREKYLKIATESLEELLCTNLCGSSDPRYYETRDGYRTVFTDIFSSIDEIKADDVVIDPSKYDVYQNDRRNGKWFNSIVFKERMSCKELEVSGAWGFGNSMPSDLQSVLAHLFGQISRKNTVRRDIKSKKNEDFTITYSDLTSDDIFLADYGSTINKYSQCHTNMLIDHGDTKTRLQYHANVFYKVQ